MGKEGNACHPLPETMSPRPVCENLLHICVCAGTHTGNVVTQYLYQHLTICMTIVWVD